MNTITNILQLLKAKDHKIFEYLLVLLILSNIAPQNLRTSLQQFSGVITPIGNQIPNELLNINNLLILYCISISLSALQIIFHWYKVFVSTERLDGVCYGIFFNLNVLSTFMLLILTNLFPHFIHKSNITFVISKTSLAILLPLLFFYISFLVTHLKFIWETKKLIDKWSLEITPVKYICRGVYFFIVCIAFNHQLWEIGQSILFLARYN